MLTSHPDLNGKSILITGGTGSFGRKFVETLIQRYPQMKKLVILSRDELKQFEMQQDLSIEQYPFLRYFLGDIRDEARLKRAFEGIDVVVHAAIRGILVFNEKLIQSQKRISTNNSGHRSVYLRLK